MTGSAGRECDPGDAMARRLEAAEFTIEMLRRDLGQHMQLLTGLDRRVDTLERRWPEPEINARDAAALRLLLPALAQLRCGWVTTAQVMSYAGEPGAVGDQLRAALAPFWHGKSPSRRIGQFLGRCEGAASAGYRLRVVPAGDGNLHNVELAGF